MKDSIKVFVSFNEFAKVYVDLFIRKRLQRVLKLALLYPVKHLINRKTKLKKIKITTGKI